MCAGNLVLLRNSKRDTKKGDKMQPKWLGPYVVVSSTGKGVYRIKNPSSEKVLKNAVHCVRLKPYHTADAATSGVVPPAGLPITDPTATQPSGLSDPTASSSSTNTPTPSLTPYLAGTKLMYYPWYSACVDQSHCWVVVSSQQLAIAGGI